MPEMESLHEGSLRVQKLLFSVLDTVVFAMATKKHKAEEMEVAEVFTPQCDTMCVIIHGVVTELSPVKCSKKKCQNKIIGWKTNRWEDDDVDGFISASTEATITSIIGCSDVSGTK